MKQNLEIQNFEDKLTKANKRYTRFQTDQGWMSCFDTISCTALKENVGKTMSCEVAQSGDFKNIQKLLGSAEAEEEVPIVKVGESYTAEKAVRKAWNPNENKTATMYTSYAKDIFVAMNNANPDIEPQDGELMKQAIELVKQAKEAFE